MTDPARTTDPWDDLLVFPANDVNESGTGELVMVPSPGPARVAPLEASEIALGHLGGDGWTPPDGAP